MKLSEQCSTIKIKQKYCGFDRSEADLLRLLPVLLLEPFLHRAALGGGAKVRILAAAVAVFLIFGPTT